MSTFTSNRLNAETITHGLISGESAWFLENIDVHDYYDLRIRPHKSASGLSGALQILPNFSQGTDTWNHFFINATADKQEDHIEPSVNLSDAEGTIGFMGRWNGSRFPRYDFTRWGGQQGLVLAEPVTTNLSSPLDEIALVAAGAGINLNHYIELIGYTYRTNENKPEGNVTSTF